VPLLEEWHLSRLDFDPDLGRNRLVCVLTGAGTTVTATIDAGDFADLRDNASNNPVWNGSAYHDLAVQLSGLIQEQVLVRIPPMSAPMRYASSARRTALSPGHVSGLSRPPG
jgi:hypothetical protein